MNILLPAVAVGAVLLLYLSWKASRNPGGSLPAEARQQLHRELHRPRRVPIVIPVEIKGHQRKLTGLTKNLAVGGVLLRPEGRLSAGEPVQVVFVLPDGGPRIEMPGAVCRLQGDDAAIRFDAADKQRFLIEQWIEARDAPRAGKPE